MCIYINPKYVLNGLFELARFDVSFSDQLFHGKKKKTWATARGSQVKLKMKSTMISAQTKNCDREDNSVHVKLNAILTDRSTSGLGMINQAINHPINLKIS
jgi:hypothetical protein